MTSADTEDRLRTGPQNVGTEGILVQGEYHMNETVANNKCVSRPGDGMKKRKKRPAKVATAPAFKKCRTSVQRTHSPRTVPTPTPSQSRSSVVQYITPTVLGIKEMASHIAKPPSISMNSSRPPLVVVPTECTYEVCTLMNWSKKEKLSDAETAYREDQLNQLQLASSSTNLHVYLQHHNIKHIDRILEFPKKAFATRQNPEVRCAFNESRLLFQKLADNFWPGPVHIYLPPQSFAPDGLMQSKFGNKKFIGFRCPSHPLTVKVLKQISQNVDEPAVVVASPIRHMNSMLLKSKDVSNKYAQHPACVSSARVQILHGEERRESFSVPTCQFREDWLECWIVPEKRAIVLKGKSKRDVIPQLKEVLRSQSSKNRVVRSILELWKVADYRGK